jgi:hypothetical protein
VLILDNTAIYSGGNAGNVKHYLRDKVIDGRPLNILIVFFSCTQLLELNPIKLVFHILGCQICSFRYHMAGLYYRAIIHQITKVLDVMPYKTMLECYAHCGY